MENNIHNRSESDIRKAIDEWQPTPSSYTVLEWDECLFNSADDTEEISDVEDEKDRKAESLDAISEDDDTSNAMKDLDDEFSDIGGDDEPINEVNFEYKSNLLHLMYDAAGQNSNGHNSYRFRSSFQHPRFS